MDVDGGDPRDEGCARAASEGAAALADMVAAAGSNKALALEHGGVDALLGCIRRTPNTRREVVRRRLLTSYYSSPESLKRLVSPA